VGSNIRAGKLVALGVTSSSRYRLFPEVPTIAESGVPGFKVESWYGILAPTGTPRDAILWLNREINKALQSSAVRQNYDGLGVETLGHYARAVCGTHPPGTRQVGPRSSKRQAYAWSKREKLDAYRTISTPLRSSTRNLVRIEDLRRFVVKAAYDRGRHAAGAIRPCHPATSKSRNPCSDTIGYFGHGLRTHCPGVPRPVRLDFTLGVENARFQEQGRAD